MQITRQQDNYNSVFIFDLMIYQYFTTSLHINTLMTNFYFSSSNIFIDYPNIIHLSHIYSKHLYIYSSLINNLFYFQASNIQPSTDFIKINNSDIYFNNYKYTKNYVNDKHLFTDMFRNTFSFSKIVEPCKIQIFVLQTIYL